MNDDEVLNILDDVMDNGDTIPAKVSNRLLLAAVRKNYRLAHKNSELIDRNLREVKDIIEKQRSDIRILQWIIGAIIMVIGILHGLPLVGLLP